MAILDRYHSGAAYGGALVATFRCGLRHVSAVFLHRRGRWWLVAERGEEGLTRGARRTEHRGHGESRSLVRDKILRPLAAGNGATVLGMTPKTEGRGK